MTVIRVKPQEYATVVALQAETLAPQANDLVMCQDINRIFMWSPTSTATDDGTHVIAQTAIATGRWVISSASSANTGTGNSDAMPPGTDSEFTINVPGVLLANANLVAVTNAGSFAAGVQLMSAAVTADATVTATLLNTSGAAVAAQAVNVTVLTL